MEPKESSNAKAVPTPEPVPHPLNISPKNGEAAAPSQQTDKIEGVAKGVRMEVSPLFEAAVQRAIKSSKRPLPEEMSISQAAEFLDVPREYILKRIKRGELACRLVKKRGRIPSASLLEEREKRFQRATKAAEEITQISQELGLYNSDMPPG